MSIFKRTPRPEQYEKGRVYDYTTAEGRVATAEWLFQQARDERAAVEAASTRRGRSPRPGRRRGFLR